ncbi:MAG: hypothetical protein PHO56_01555 [Patescibacteria group bacterium]|nr:hypothetical protein [Patescibacteria group bacterium]
MNIVIDFTPILNFFSLPADVILAKALFYFGWIPVAMAFLWGAFELWIFYRQSQWAAKNAKYTLLAIDIPRGNEQSPRAVENLFAYLGGAHGTINLIEKYWEGKFQMGFSFEIISTGGYTQFLIRTPIVQRDLVESAIYAQYPDAEITEVDDYATAFQDVRFPNDKYDIVGAEFIQTMPKAYPIKTYEEFEHMMGEPETHFKDPMAALMDLCSSMRPGENFWLQLLVIPTGFDWIDDLDKEVSKILGEKAKFNKNILHYGADAALGIISAASSAVMAPVEPAKKIEKKDDALKMMNLKPKQKKRVEGIEKKSGKIAFEFKIRFVYIAEKEIFNKAKSFGGIVGYMKQFAALDSNNLKPDMDKTATSTAYLFRLGHLNARKNRILRNYINRDTVAGRKRGLFNVEELATIWHFPNEGTVKAPMIQKAPGRKAEPPMTLPQAEEIVGEEKAEPLFLGDLEESAAVGNKPAARRAEPPTTEKITEDDKGTPPENLPFV